MKESKFIELLNLYVDHRISDAEAALLEIEIQQSPKRYQVYRQYCQMHKACSMLANNFRVEAPPAAAAVAGKVVEFAPGRRRFYLSRAYAVAAMAAAACVATVFLMPRNHAGQGLQPQTAPVAAEEHPLSLQPQFTPTAAALPELQPVFPGFVRDTAMADSSDTLYRPSFDWMTRVQLQHVSIDDLKFATQPASLRTEEITLHSRNAANRQVEEMAFRFQK